MIFELRHCFQQLQLSLTELQQQLQQQRPEHWLALTPYEQEHSTSLTVLCDLIGDLWYADEKQDGRTTRSRHGVVLISPEMANKVKEINALKEEFKQKTQQVRATLKEQGLREAMQSSELARVHLRQCYRLLPLIENQPLKIGFSWYVNGRSIRKLTLTQAEKMLLDLGEEKPHIQQQLNKLYALTEGTWLAQVQNLAPVVRANLVLAEGKKALNAPLPLFIVNQGQGMPEFNQIGLTPPEGRSRKARADQKIEPEPYLPSLRIHLYR